jgi:ribonuclease T1
VPALLLRLFLCLAVLLASPLSSARSDPTQIDDVALNALPSEARQTVALIDRGGPFPYRRDGVVFQNRERLLPARDRGCYREYTVSTPGSSDRGARRIVSACEGVQYYSDDHYRSFRKIRR